MSRSGYSDDSENLAMWRGAVKRAAQGKRGKAMLRRLITALDAMPEKRLAAHSFQAECGDCTLGALARHEGLDTSDLEPTNEGDEVDRDRTGKRFDIAPALAAEIMFLNDEWDGLLVNRESGEERWKRMRRWAENTLNGVWHG